MTLPMNPHGDRLCVCRFRLPDDANPEAYGLQVWSDDPRFYFVCDSEMTREDGLCDGCRKSMVCCYERLWVAAMRSPSS